MKAAIVSAVNSVPQARPEVTGDGHRQAKEMIIQALEKSGKRQAAEKLSAFYAKHPMRSPRRGELGATELVRQARDGDHRR